MKYHYTSTTMSKIDKNDIKSGKNVEQKELSYTVTVV